MVFCNMFNGFNMKINFLIGFFLSIFFWSCQSNNTSPDIPIEPLQAEVYLRYLETEQQLKAEISFTTVDSTKESKPKKMDEVLFQKLAMQEKKIKNNYRYQLSRIVSLSEQFDFEYDNKGKNAAVPSISINPIEDFFIQGNQISKSTKNTIAFKGKLLKANESLILLFSDSNNKVTTVAIAGPSSDLGITLYPAQIKGLKLGKGSLYMVRRQRIEEKNNDFTLTGLTEYYTKVIEVQIEE